MEHAVLSVFLEKALSLLLSMEYILFMQLTCAESVNPLETSDTQCDLNPLDHHPCSGEDFYSNFEARYIFL